MKFRFASLAIPVLLLTLSSCQEVIDIDLNESESRIVIEGGIYENSDSALVKISKTTSFFDNAPADVITQAEVKLIMPDGSEVLLPSIGNGLYKANGLSFQPDNDYRLEVQVDDETFTATSRLMPSVVLDSLELEYQEPFFGNPASHLVFLRFQDAPGKNYYRVVYWVNGVLANSPEQMQVFDDNLNDGNYIRIPLFGEQFSNPLDVIRVELQSIDPALYEFYQTFASAASADAGSPFTAAPANPATNITGGALGVFGAYTRSSRETIIPE